MSVVTVHPLPLWQSCMLLAPVLAALAGGLTSRRASTLAVAWQWARAATAAMLGVAIASAVIRAASPDRASELLRSDTVGSVMLIVVSFVGCVVVRYCEAYLAGDPNERRCIGRLLATLAAVSAVVVANHLLVLVFAWTATSLAMHGLLTFFADRPVAVAVAHKKFLLARCADACMLGAVVAFGATFDTLRIDRIAGLSTNAALPTGARFGIALVATAALLKCAQLPFHGWLIQVMEAPTPFSALLHAGVVNLGGFVLLRFAPVVDRAIETRVLLVSAGTATAVLAALVMTTRISVKVSLAWSTCAQMGFMVMQCGLGAWGMALLHLVAHSLYKAYAFLSAGSAVREMQRRQLAPRPVPPTTTGLVLALAWCTAGTLVAGGVVGRLPFAHAPSATVWVLGGIVALAVVPLVGDPFGVGGLGLGPKAIGGAFGVPLVYLALHELVGNLVPDETTAPTVLLLVVATAFALLFVAQVRRTTPSATGLLARAYPWVYGGFYLDEAFTRVAFAIWAPPATRPRLPALPRPNAAPVSSTEWVRPALHVTAATNLNRSFT